MSKIPRITSLIYTSLVHAKPTRIMEELGNYGKRKNRTAILLRRIPLEGLMDLKVDYAFKQLFGNEKNKDITMVFLNAILHKTGRDRIKDISFKNTEAGGEYVDDKQSRLDLLIITEARERINVEIQFANKYDMVKRSIYYWAGTYRDPLKKSMSYKELQPVITINIMNFNLFDHTERFHTMFHLCEDEEKFRLTDIMEFHFIEMPKLIKAWKEEKLDPWNNVLARWLLLLGIVDHRNNKIYEDIYKELEEIALGEDKELRYAIENWEELSMTQEQYLAYEGRLKQINDDVAFKREMELWAREEIKEGVEKGLAEAKLKVREEAREEVRAEVREEARAEARKEVLKEKEEIALRLLNAGMEIDFVAKSTGLKKDKVIAIQKENKL